MTNEHNLNETGIDRNVTRRFSIRPSYKLVFMGCVILILLAFLASLFISVFVPNPNKNLLEFISICNSIFKCGVPSIISLALGRAL